MTHESSQPSTALPPVVSREEWQIARDALLVKEKAHTRAGDAVSAARRRLPMVKMEKDYRFEGPNGEVPFLDLFEGRKQLIIQHFMYGPDWDAGCPSCTATTNQFGSLDGLEKSDTTFILISRAPYEKLAAWKEKMGWRFPWYSAFNSTFNQDFGMSDDRGEGQGFNVFLTDGESIYHTYSTGGRGVEALIGTFGFRDLTPYGRQEEWEDSPAGWPQRPTYG
jgi:predicted dithiol-disulfide oxidoreductase (DUF899 family)